MKIKQILAVILIITTSVIVNAQDVNKDLITAFNSLQENNEIFKNI